MTAGDALPPVAVEATDAAGVALIEAYVARRRAELARLSLAVRTARQRCDTAEAELAGAADADGDGAPADLLGVVDAMLDKAMAASELALASAEREGSFIIDRAIADAAEILRRVGLDPAVLFSERPATTSVRGVVAPPTAVELWRATRRIAAARPAGPVSTPAHDRAVSPVVTAAPVAPHARGPVASAPFVPVVVSDQASVEGASAPASSTAVSGTLLLDMPAPIADPGEAFDTFWQEVPGERRVRDRLLRRSPKESA